MDHRQLPRTVFPFSMAFFLAAVPLGGCGPEPAGPSTLPPDGAATLPPDAGAGCQTLAPEELFPPFDFVGNLPGMETGSVGRDGAPSNPGMLGDGGGLRGGPSDGAPPDGDPQPIVDGKIAPPPLNGRFPNEFGRGANEVLPGTNLGSFEDRDGALGTNGRSCATCHADEDQWTSTPATFKQRFDTGYSSTVRSATNESATGNDDLEPIFRTVDGSNSPHSDVSSPAARNAAYSMLLTRAVIRVGLPVPSDADFELVSVDDPYEFASATELSLFRRPPVMANLRFNTTLMWDGRRTETCATLKSDLVQQANDAVKGHAKGSPAPETRVATIVDSELLVYFAQYQHVSAGPLDQDGARGGPWFLAQVPFYVGINAFEKTDPRGHAYDREVFSLYQSWQGQSGDATVDQARAQIAEGERIFNSREFTIRGVSGLNDELGRSEISATCGACHNTPNVGTNSEGWLMDIGVSSEGRRTADLPLYTFQERATGAITKTTDPGQALISKKWAHMNRFKIPNLRGLSGRGPYLHDGSATSLADVVDYHDQRFDIGLAPAEKAALVIFLSAL